MSLHQAPKQHCHLACCTHTAFALQQAMALRHASIDFELGAMLQNGLADPEQVGEPGAKLQGSQAAASRAWLVLARMTWVCTTPYDRLESPRSMLSGLSLSTPELFSGGADLPSRGS